MKKILIRFIVTISILLILLGCFLLLLPFGSALGYLKFAIWPIDLDASSKYGEFVGGVVGSLWMLSSTLLFISSLMLQRDELSLQRESIARQQKDIDRNFDFGNHQNFERMLFDFVGRQGVIVENIKINNKRSIAPKEDNFREGELVGDKALIFILDQFKYIFKNKINIEHVSYVIEFNFPTAAKVINCYRINNVFERFPRIHSRVQSIVLFSMVFYCYHESISHYFRHYYYTLKFIDTAKKQRLNRCGLGADACIIENEYLYYAKLTSARLSIPEMVLLFYNGLLFPEMGEYLQTYKILSALVSENLVDESHSKFYKSMALADRNDFLFSIFDRYENI